MTGSTPYIEKRPRERDLERARRHPLDENSCWLEVGAGRGAGDCDDELPLD